MVILYPNFLGISSIFPKFLGFLCFVQIVGGVFMYNSQEVALTIKSLAKEKKIAIGKMLSDCDLSKNALSTMQSGGYLPRTESLAKIADYLNVSIDLLLGREINQKTALTNIEESDSNKERLLRNYDDLNEVAQIHLANYSDFMVSDVNNLKSDIQNNQMNT